MRVVLALSLVLLFSPVSAKEKVMRKPASSPVVLVEGKITRSAYKVIKLELKEGTCIVAVIGGKKSLNNAISTSCLPIPKNQ